MILSFPGKPNTATRGLLDSVNRLRALTQRLGDYNINQDAEDLQAGLLAQDCNVYSFKAYANFKAEIREGIARHAAKRKDPDYEPVA